MTAAILFFELRALGVVLSSSGDGILQVNAPPGVLTDRHRQQLQEHKEELARIVYVDPAPVYPTDDPDSVLNMEIGPDGWPVGSILMGDLDPCPKCGTLELWKNLLGEWRCQRCDPISERALKFMEDVELLRQKWKPKNSTCDLESKDYNEGDGEAPQSKNEGL